MSTTVILEKICCVKTSEPGSDEVFFTYKIDDRDEVRYPPSGYQQMNPGQCWVLDMSFTFNDTLKITLLDDDNWPSTDDYLGSNTYTPSNIPPEVTVSGSGAVYEVFAREASAAQADAKKAPQATGGLPPIALTTR